MRSIIKSAAWFVAVGCAASAFSFGACSADPVSTPRDRSVPVISQASAGTAANAVPSTFGGSAAQVSTGTAGIASPPPVITQPGLAGTGAPVPNTGVAGQASAAGMPAVVPPPPPAAGQAAAKPMVVVSPDQKLPPVTDYAAAGPFAPGKEVDNTGPGGSYTIFRPTNLAANGFKFIPATWGNGITTTPQYYPWLNTVASHGFVIIAANSSTVTPDDMTKGLDWLIAQNDMPGDFQGKLDVSRAVCIGYSLGGGGAITCGAHPKVIATVAMHPAAGPTSGGLHGPLLLFSGTNDTVCVPKSFVQPAFDVSPVPTFFGMLDGADHLEPVVGGRETAPFIAWLRLWVFGDEGAKSFFYGADCKLCKAPWTMPQSKLLP